MKPVRLFSCVALALMCLNFPAQGFARPEIGETVEAGGMVSSKEFAVDDEAGPSTTMGIGGEIGARHAGATSGEVDLGHSSPNPYKAMIEDLVAAPKSQQRRTETIPGTAPHVPEQRTLLYDEGELKSRVDSVKATVSSMFAGDAPDAQSEEERELKLQRDIAMREAYRGASLGGSGALSSSSNSDGQEKAAKIRLVELAFLAWDLLTHPVTIALLLMYGFGRLVVAMLRVTKDPRGRRKKLRRSRSSSRNATKSASAPVVALTEFELEQERRHRDRRRRSRRHRSRRSFLDRFRSV